LPSTIVAHAMEPQPAATVMQLERAHQIFSSAAEIAQSRRPVAPPGVTLLRADDNSYAFAVAVNAGDARLRIARFRVALAHRSVAVGPFSVPSRNARVVPVGFSPVHLSSEPLPSLATPPPFSDPDGTTIANARLHVVFAPFAGARIAELGGGKTNAATSIGLLRDATDPAPPVSSRDYIASYTHPLPAGTFNRMYRCSRLDTGMTTSITCSYDAPDVPQGGALFERTLKLGADTRDVVVDERFTPHDARSTARLESISGFAFDAGDMLLTSNAGDARGILHRGKLVVLRWRAGDVADVQTRTTRGAEIVTLVFAKRSIELRLGVYAVRDAAEARRVLDANQR
jgi:hypothetical protein